MYRLGFGAMRLTGPGIWGPPVDKHDAIAVLHRTLELGVNLLDTADSYGSGVSESLIAEALYPYPKDLVIATEGGPLRTGPNQWPTDGRPEHLRKHWRAACGVCASITLTSIDSIAQTQRFHSKILLVYSRR